ncbi:hypothetical protein [Kluyvera georgiana]|uniref:hypothetical protein n=1 Tax=Kluyvera georgiana TaxID=73098 RepID=UPI00080711E6|nr:hypothetical protein [Kluyvera georgiana]
MKLTEQQLTEELIKISYISDIQVINTEEGYVIHSENSKVLVLLDTGDVHSAGRDFTFVDGFDIGHVNTRQHISYLRHNLNLNINFLKLSHMRYIKGLIEETITEPYKLWVKAEMEKKFT